MAHRIVLGIGVLATALCPFISTHFEISLTLLIPAVFFLLVWIQEIWIIQYQFKDDNVDFTRRFFERYPRSGRTWIMGYLHWILSASLLVIVWFNVGEYPNTQGMIITVLLFCTLIRIFDPLLGCVNTYEGVPWSKILVYFAVFVFATTSAVNTSALQYLPIPSEYSLAFILALLSFVTLQLRMAYYEFFCFQLDSRLEIQMKLIVSSLLVISLPQLFSIVHELSANING